MSQSRKYGSAKEWFTFSVSVLGVGLLLLGSSWVPTAVLLPFSWLFRLLGIGCASLGILIAIWGVRVWRYNLKHDSTPSTVVVGKATPAEDGYGLLIRRRDELEVELAGIEAQVYDGGPSSLISLMSGRTPADVERRAAIARTKKRMEQVEANLRGINAEIHARWKDSQRATRQMNR